MQTLRAFFHDAEEGQALVVIAITMLAMLFGVGLAIDSGQLFNGRRTAQEAADAASFAGATVLYQGGTVAQATSAATDDAALNGYAANLPTSGTTVTVSSPPASGPFSGSAAYVEVVISTPVRTSLVPQQAGVTTVRARGVAGNVTRANAYAVMALDQSCTPAGAISVGSTGLLQVTGGGIELNSCSTSAGTNTGSVSLAAGYTTDVVGNVSGTWPNVRAGRPVAPDPLAGLPRPSTNGLSSYLPACSPAINQPGIYTSSFVGTGSCSYVLAPGTYILKGAGVNLSGNSTLCTGTSCTPATTAGGVMLFLTSSSYPATGGTCGTFSLQGNSGSSLSGPTSGTYPGMLLWQDAVCTGTLTFGGTGELDVTNGTIYAPTATVQANGSNAQIEVSQIVAKRIDVANGKFEVNFATSLTYQSPLPALVE